MSGGEKKRYNVRLPRHLKENGRTYRAACICSRTSRQLTKVISIDWLTGNSEPIKQLADQANMECIQNTVRRVRLITTRADDSLPEEHDLISQNEHMSYSENRCNAPVLSTDSSPLGKCESKRMSVPG